MVSFSAKPATVKRDWYIVDATGKTLGRLASEIAKRLRGKHKPEYTPHVDTGDCIVVINARHVRVTGNKMRDKTYFHHSGYPGGIKSRSYTEMLKKKPEEIFKRAVKGMLPRGHLGRMMLSKLKIYADASHRHTAQQPKILEI